MRVALVETDTVWEDPAANRDRIRAAVPAGDLAVLPETCFTGFTMDAAPDPEDERFLRELARERGTALVAGLVGPGPANTAVAVAADGTVLARYEKLHAFNYVGEGRHYRPGRALPVFDLGPFRAAMFICYDLRVPEAFREAARNGAELMVVIANWPRPRIDHWRTLLKARAIENQACVVGVNRIGKDPNAEYESSSMAVGPKGEVLLEGAGTVELDPSAVRRWRKAFPALDDMRDDRCVF